MSERRENFLKRFTSDHLGLVFGFIAICGIAAVGSALVISDDVNQRQEAENYLHLDCLNGSKAPAIGFIENWQPGVEYPVTSYLDAEVQMLPIGDDKHQQALIFAAKDSEAMRTFDQFDVSPLSDGLNMRTFQGSGSFQNVLITGTLKDKRIYLQGVCR
jgi:hypothetical protein